MMPVDDKRQYRIYKHAVPFIMRELYKRIKTADLTLLSYIYEFALAGQDVFSILVATVPAKGVRLSRKDQLTLSARADAAEQQALKLFNSDLIQSKYAIHNIVGLDKAVVILNGLKPVDRKPTYTLRPPPINQVSVTNKILLTLFCKKLKTQYSLYTPLHMHISLLAITNKTSLEYKLLANIYMNYKYIAPMQTRLKHARELAELEPWDYLYKQKTRAEKQAAYNVVNKFRTTYYQAAGVDAKVKKLIQIIEDPVLKIMIILCGAIDDMTADSVLPVDQPDLLFDRTSRYLVGRGVENIMCRSFDNNPDTTLSALSVNALYHTLTLLRGDYNAAKDYLEKLDLKRQNIYKSRYLDEYIHAIEWFTKNRGSLLMFNAQQADTEMFIQEVFK